MTAATCSSGCIQLQHRAAQPACSQGCACGCNGLGCTASAVGTSPYRLESRASYHGDIIETRSQPSAAACATGCTLWQSQGIPCAAWSWLPPKDNATQGECTLLSKLIWVRRLSIEAVAGSIGKLPDCMCTTIHALCCEPAAGCKAVLVEQLLSSSRRASRFIIQPKSMLWL